MVLGVLTYLFLTWFAPHSTYQANLRGELCMSPVLTRMPVLQGMVHRHLDGHARLSRRHVKAHVEVAELGVSWPGYGGLMWWL